MLRHRGLSHVVDAQRRVGPKGGTPIPEEDALRARFYSLLAHLLAQPPSADTLDMLRGLSGDDTEMGAALAALAAVAARTSVADADREYHGLFIGLVRGELMPYGSYYLTGFLHEKPLANVRGDMIRLGVARAPSVREPEDHIAVLCEIMHGLITGEFGEQAPLETQREFFDAHLGPWASRFFGDLEAAKAAVLYTPIGTVGRVFMAIEAEGFALSRP